MTVTNRYREQDFVPRNYNRVEVEERDGTLVHLEKIFYVVFFSSRRDTVDSRHDSSEHLHK